jgi:glycosyltransferase involved in cell wall biosynthesis
MNIAIISTFDNVGGAAIAAYRLFKGLKKLKQGPVMLVKEKKSNGPGIYKVKTKAPEYNIERMLFQQIHKKEIDQDRTVLSNTWYTIPYPGYDLSKTQLIANSDIINLHWAAEFQSVETISNLLKTVKPVVWTLHDENPYTGGCHYTAGCTKYQADCIDCLQLKDNRYQIPFYNLKNKINLWNKNLTIVTPSKWLAECARKSRVFKDLRVEVIPNSLETDIFKPKAKDLAKKELGLDTQLITLLFGAYTGHEKRKGFAKLLDTMKHCLKYKEFKDLVKKKGIKILTFGPPQVELEKLAIEIESIGYIDDNEKLSTIYSAADIFILPSLEDNLPNTMLEAMACGTPVVSFEVGGMPDMITNGITGYMAPPFDVKTFGEIIIKIIFSKDERKQMELNCRQLIEKKFKLQDQAENYLALFEDLLKSGKVIPKSKRKKSTGIVSKSGEIILNEWISVVRKDMFNVYRRAALDLIDYQDNGIETQPSTKDDVIRSLQSKYEVSEKDRAARLEVIHRQAKEFNQREKELENIIALKTKEINAMRKSLILKLTAIFRLIYRKIKRIIRM